MTKSHLNSRPMKVRINLLSFMSGALGLSVKIIIQEMDFTL
jgi:hypothetical protein